MTTSDENHTPQVGRVLALDLARSAALLAMAVFHFAFDLEMFGWLRPGTVINGGWRTLALGTAGSFLFLAGVSLWLAHGQMRRWPGFWRRFAQIAAAALLISVATRVALGDAFIFFGILHSIAVASLIGMALLRVPAVVLLGLAVALFAAPYVSRSEIFDWWGFWWTGLQTVPVRSVDYVPVVPWLAPLLIGVALGQIGSRLGVWARLARWQGGALARRLAWPGRHSLIVYLLHQPVLITLVAGATYLLR